jgi:hypothetical protein
MLMLRTIILRIIELIRGKPKLNENDCYITFQFVDNDTIITSDSKGTAQGFYIGLLEGVVKTKLEKHLGIQPQKMRKSNDDSDNLHYPPSQFYGLTDKDDE